MTKYVFGILIFTILLSSSAIAMPNPSAVYCEKMGYTYKVDKTQGGERGICVVKPGIEFKAWDFFRGKVGKKYSYCAKKGYDTETEYIDREVYSEEYAVCVSKDNFDIKSLFGITTEKVRIPMDELMDQEGVSLIYTPPSTIGRDKEGNKIEDKEFLDLLRENTPTSQKDLNKFSVLGALPSSFDWRNYNGKDWVTSVKDQKVCGSCWAFSAMGAFEAKLNIDNNNPNLDYDLSEQQLISCTDAGTCNGGSYPLTLGYMIGSGVVDENCFSYKGSDVFCDLCSNWRDRAVRIANYVYITNTTTAYKQALIDYGPLVVNVDATNWSSYYGGIFIDSNQSESNHNVLNHNVLLVGYNDTGDYWIIKNSWNTNWGENGYIRLSYTNDPITTFGGTYAIEQTVSLIEKGELKSYLIGPTSSINVTKNQFFNFSTGVRCVDGYCGDVMAILDPETELYYDDGIPKNPWGDSNHTWAVGFTSPIYPFTVTEVRINLYDPNSVGNYSATISIYGDNNGAIGDKLISFNTTIDTFYPMWEEIDLNVSINKKDFWIGITVPGTPNGPFALTDENTTTLRTRKSSDGEIWTSMEKDFMLRAVIQEMERTTLFYDGFESGTITSNWITYKNSSYGRIEVTSSNESHNGAYHLTMDVNSSMYNLNELITNVSLEGYNEIELSFYHKEFDDDDNICLNSWAGHNSGDCIAISCDGTTWYKILDLTESGGISSTYKKFTLDISNGTRTICGKINESFKIKFQQYGNLPISEDGFAFDDIKITYLKGKGTIPINNGMPFYTINPNPTICSDMESNQTCNTTWLVNATGETGTEWIFYTIYTPINYSLNTNETSKIIIKIVNRAPTLNPINNITVNETDLINIIVNASDPDNDILTYYVNDSRFSQRGNIFSWQTPDSSAGIYVVNITVGDYEFNISQLVTITINDVCIPNWIEINTSCRTNDTQIGYYIDNNSCYEKTNLLSDLIGKPNNNTYECNYCSENIQGHFYTDWTECNKTDSQSRIKYYSDLNYASCCAITKLYSDCHINNRTYNNITEIQSCDYCTSTWQNINSSCLINDTFIIGYVYTNDCCTQTGLESDCNIPKNATAYCNYCLENIQGHFYTDWTECNKTDSQSRIKYYSDLNYASCCAITKLYSDCHINNRTYNNITEIQSCDYCTSTWQNINSSCLINDTFIVGYVYTNNCCEQTDLPSDCTIPENITAPCNYCSENIIGPFNTSCMQNDSLVQYYIDENLNSCCAITNLESDCDIIYNESYHNKSLWCDYCTPNLVNTSWSDWISETQCLMNDTIIQKKTRTQYDSNNCGEVENITFSEYKTIECDYCTPNWYEVNESCQPDDTFTGWYNDSNNCYAITGLESDLEDRPENNTYLCIYAYQYNFTLIKNWNLLSLPLKPLNTSITSIFKNINFSSIFTYNGTWLYYYNETKNNFNTIDITKAYWINSLNNQTLTIEGTEFTYPINLTLTKGWNLISYPSLNTSLINKTLENYSSIFAYYSNNWFSNSKDRPNNLDSLKNFTPGFGYWVYSDNQTNLTINS